MAQAFMPLHYWSDTFFTTVFLLNGLPTRFLSDMSPHELLFKQQRDYPFFYVFGSLCFSHLRPYNAHKLDFHSSPCVFLGYCSSYHDYRFLDATIQVYIIYLDMFPFTSLFFNLQTKMEHFSDKLL